MDGLKAFISYSHADEAHKDKLIQYLCTLRRSGTLESWDDRQLLAGDKLDPEIKERLSSADLVILLISQDFLASYYCYEVELARTLEMANEGSARIVSIIIDHCTWKETPIKDFVLLPQDAVPVSDFSNPSKAWLGISEQIKKVCEVLKKRTVIEPVAEFEFVQNKLLDEFEDFLNSNEIILHHRAKEDVSLDDVYIDPDLRALDVEPEKFENIISSAKLLSASSCPTKSVVVGEEQSGKTSLVKQIFKKHLDSGEYPVLIHGSEIKSTNVKEAIDSAKNKQYESQLFSSKTIIVEEVEQSKLNARFLPEIIRQLLDLDVRVIFVSGRELRFNESIWKEFSEISRYEVLPFGHMLRGALINKWNSLGQETTIDLAELHALNDRVTHHIDSLLRKNIVPPKPIFILMILQTLESASPSDFSLTAYGHCYNALIQQSMRKSKIKNENVDKYVNYLTELAYFIFKMQKTHLSDDEFGSFKQEYSLKYLIDSHEKVVGDMCKSGLLRVDYNGTSFAYKYIYYFYAAKHIAENYNGVSSSEIADLCRKMHSEKHANILIFITYHTKDQRILDEILSFAESIFSDEKPATLEFEDTEHFEDLLVSIPGLVMEQKTAEDIESHRKSNLDRKDRFEKIVSSEDVDDDLIETHTFADINRSAKAVEIIGQILRNRQGSLKIDQLNALSNTAFLTGLRFLSFYFKITKSLKGEIVEALSKLLENEASLTDGEVRDQARKLFYGFCYSMSFSVIKKISFSTGNDQLIPIFKSIADEIDTPAVHLISLCIQLEFTKKINRDSILEAAKKIGRRSIAYRLLQEIIIQHLYLHNVDYNDRQWLSSKLDIPIKDQRVVQGQKKTKMLS